jgi:hypothetical protein
MKRFLSALVFVVIAVASAEAIAGSANDMSVCGDAQQEKKFEEGIEACTRALNARGINASDQAFAYQRRGSTFFALRKYDEAIVDSARSSA